MAKGRFSTAQKLRRSAFRSIKAAEFADLAALRRSESPMPFACAVHVDSQGADDWRQAVIRSIADPAAAAREQEFPRVQRMYEAARQIRLRCMSRVCRWQRSINLSMPP